MTNPHVVGYTRLLNDLSKLGLYQWDYVLLINCPISDSLVYIQLMCRAARWLLKNNGQLIHPSGLTATYFLESYYDIDDRVYDDQIEEFQDAYWAGHIPEVDLEYQRIAHTEFYSKYIPIHNRGFIMTV
jgi:hypothetical protein